MAIEIQLPGGKRVRLRRRGDLNSYQTHLKKSHGTKTPAICYCTDGGVKMSVKLRDNGRREHYYLQSHKSESHKHAERCFYGPTEARGGDGLTYRDGVLHFDLSLRMREARDAEPDLPKEEDDEDEQQGGGNGSRAIRNRLLHILKTIWEDAGLDYYDPKESPTTSVDAMDVLYEVARHPTEIGRLRDSLLLVPSTLTSDSLTLWKRRGMAQLRKAASERQRLIVLGEVHNLQTGQWPFIKNLSNLLGWKATWDETVGEAAKRQFDKAWPLSSDSAARVLLIAFAEVDVRRERLNLRFPALMPTTKEFIPVESSYELQVARALISEKRRFRKPLFDDDEDTVPDFQLLDVRDDEPYVLEVFGMNTAAYLERAARKTTYYDRVYGSGGWWRWWAARGPMPAFPAAAT